MTDRFSVHQFFDDGTNECVARDVEPKEAVETAKRLTVSVGGQIGTTKRVIITDDGDFTNFEWKFGEGVTYPPNDGKKFIADQEQVP